MNKTEELRNKLREASREIRENSTWKHYKGGIYTVKGLAIDTDNGELRVLYYRIDGPDYDIHFGSEQDIIFTRPLKEWLENIGSGTRFEEVRKIQVWRTAQQIKSELYSAQPL